MELIMSDYMFVGKRGVIVVIDSYSLVNITSKLWRATKGLEFP